MYRQFAKTRPKWVRKRGEKPVDKSVHELLDPCPRIGQGVHHAILGAVSKLALLGFDATEIPEMVHDWVIATSGTTPFAREIPDAVAKVFEFGDPRDLDGDYVRYPKWPAANFPRALELVRTEYPGFKRCELLHKLCLSSPYEIRIWSAPSPEEWVSFFFPAPETILCIGNRWYVQTKPFKDYVGQIGKAVSFVPNPFKEALWRGRLNDNVRERRFLVTEIDIKEKTVIEYLLRAYRIDPFDFQSGIILHLVSLDLLKLKSVVFSGNKSLHAYWVASPDEQVNRSFLSTAVSLGADKAFWAMSQPARICNHSLGQLLFYLDVSL
jgi:hypothetical protein